MNLEENIVFLVEWGYPGLHTEIIAAYDNAEAADAHILLCKRNITDEDGKFGKDWYEVHSIEVLSRVPNYTAYNENADGEHIL